MPPCLRQVYIVALGYGDCHFRAPAVNKHPRHSKAEGGPPRTFFITPTYFDGELKIAHDQLIVARASTQKNEREQFIKNISHAMLHAARPKGCSVGSYISGNLRLLTQTLPVVASG